MSGSFFVTPLSASEVVATVRGAASQSANLLQLQASDASVVANFTAPVNNVSRLNLGGTDLSATFGITVHASGGVGQVIRGAASQSANLQEWQNSGSTALASISSAGLFFGKAADATVATATTGLGYMGLPQNSTTTGSYTIVAADAGEHIYASATRTVTIPSNASVAFPVGTTLTFIAGVGATMTIAITTDTMYLAGAGTTGSRTLAAHGIATAVKTTSTTWLISGNGLT